MPPQAQRTKIYVNGTLEVTAPETSTILPDSPAPVRLGQLQGNGSSYFGGQLDEVRIYRRALSSAEVQGMFTTPGSGPANDLQAHWKLDETSGKQIADATGNHDGSYQPSAQDREGRLIRMSDRNGYGSTITYKSFTAAEISASPDLRWQIDTITDAYNRTATFHYGANQVSGRWAVERIDFPNAQQVQYNYTNGQLSDVQHADGTQSTFTYGYDNDAQTSTIEFFDAAAEGTHRTKTVFLTNNIVINDGELYNQSSLLARMVTNGSGEVSYLNASDPTDNFTRIYEGGGKLKEIRGVRYERFYEDGWTFTSGGGFDAFAGTPEASLEEADYPGNTAKMQRGEFDVYTTQTGVRREYDYDADIFPTTITYSDNTTEEYSFNQFKQVTRYKDRLNRVTKYTYDARGNVLTQEEGILEVNGNDVQQPEYAIYQWEYFPAGHANQFLLSASIDANGNRTDYEYNANQFLTKIIEPADNPGDPRAETVFTYDFAGRLKTSTDPANRTTTYFYDQRDRIIQIQYLDGSTERYAYGEPGTGAENLVVARQDRTGFVNSMEYDDHGRLTKRITASHRIPQNLVADNTQTDLASLLAGNEVTDPNVRVEYTCSYLDGTNLRSECTDRGETSSYVYDYRHRVIETTVQPRTGKTLTSKTSYIDNLAFCSEDPYGRKSYAAYRASDSAMIRSIQGTVPSYSLANFAAVLAETRGIDPEANANKLITDHELDAEGQQFATIDPRGIVHASEFDSRGRTVKNIKAATVLSSYNRTDFETQINEAALATIAAKTETLYDAQSNVVEMRTPRFFDTNDTLGNNKANVTMTYTGRNLLKTRTEAAGDVAATESFTYNLDRTLDERIDFRGNAPGATGADHAWSQIWQFCCQRKIADVQPPADVDGSGTDKRAATITLYNTYGDVTHTATISDITNFTPPIGPFTTSSYFTDLLDSETLNESTTRYDERHRPIATTRWLVPRGAVDPNNVPIAGLDGVPNSEGLTTRYFYDENLNDSAGLSGGITVSKLDGSGSFTLDISQLLSELTADGTKLGLDSDGYATAILNPEDEIQVSIMDGTGRSVASGWIEQDGTPITWGTVQHDIITNVSGFGDTLETAFIDGLDHTTKSRTDGAGRTLESVDALGFISTAQYDNNSNLLVSRDPNSVGQDCVYDARNRETSCTDTENDTTQTVYDQNNNLVKMIDAKTNEIVCTFDARGRKVDCVDRVNAQTTWTYDENNNLVSLLDGDNQVSGDATEYQYDTRNLMISEAYPGHNPSGAIGDLDYDLRLYSYDAAGRPRVFTDQQGDTITNVYDLANRLLEKQYVGFATGPLAGQSDEDTFEYDAASRMVKATRNRYAKPFLTLPNIGDIVCEFEYDNASRPISETLTTRGQSYTCTTGWDAANRKTQITYPDGSIVDRFYTDRDQLSQVQYQSSIVDTRTYDNGMRLQSCTSGNGIVTNYTYRADNLVSSITRTGLSGADFTYDYDENKNKTQETISGIMANYGFNSLAPAQYDDEDRLISWNRDDGNQDQSWNLSLVGDWDSFTEQAVTETRSHSGVHELESITGGSIAGGLSYDAKGNLTTHSNGHDYTWDFNNKLTLANVSSGEPGIAGTHNYTHDALGRRVSKTVGSTTTVFVCSGQQVLAEYLAGVAAATPIQQYVYGTYIDEPLLMDAGGTQYYYHRNHLYSVAALTDNAGNVVERYAYDAYGTPTILDAAGTTVLLSSTVDNPYFFTGRRLDEETTNLYYRARYYNSSLGRFLARDSIGYLDGTNLYRAYFVPSSLDPTGNVDVSVIGAQGSGYGPAAIDPSHRNAANYGLKYRFVFHPKDVWHVQKVESKATFAMQFCDGSSYNVYASEAYLEAFSRLNDPDWKARDPEKGNPFRVTDHHLAGLKGIARYIEKILSTTEGQSHFFGVKDGSLTFGTQNTRKEVVMWEWKQVSNFDLWSGTYGRGAPNVDFASSENDFKFRFVQYPWYYALRYQGIAPPGQPFGLPVLQTEPTEYFNNLLHPKKNIVKEFKLKNFPPSIVPEGTHVHWTKKEVWRAYWKKGMGKPKYFRPSGNYKRIK